MKRIICFLICFVAFLSIAKSELINNEDEIYFDAIVFKSDSLDARLDLFSVVPYSVLNFTKVNENLIAKYVVTFSILDSNNKVVIDKSIEKNIIAKNYYSANGGDGAFDYVSSNFHLKAGNYKVKVSISDQSNSKSFEKTRNFTAISFSNFNFSLSGLMLLSSIEEKNGKFKISPFISDNIVKLQDGFFVFFETYSKESNFTYDIVYQIINSNNEQLFQSKRYNKIANSEKSQAYVKINLDEKYAIDQYKIKIYALKKSIDSSFSQNDILAIAERSIKILPSLSANVIKDIDLAIRQLAYIANSEELKDLSNAKNDREKIVKFETFWANLDPSPNTRRNEAFDEYYSRIEYANKNFKSFQDGWLSDKGHIYIVLGPPMSTDRITGNTANTYYEKWYYSNSREFIFNDNTGFGDYRLVRPYSFSEKYTFQKR